MARDDHDDDDALAPATQPKRTTSFVARLAGKKSAHYDLATRIARERENSKYWARVLLLFPLAPVCAALTTVTIGGVVINAATDKCNSSLMTFLQGAVVLSYVLLWFFAYCWMGPAPIKSLRAVRVFYLIYGLACFVWWGLYGTMQAVSATSSGFESCLSTSPTLYIMAQYEVAVFWVLLLVFVGFVVNERTATLRQEKMQQWLRRGTTFKPKTAEEISEEAAHASVMTDAAERAEAAEEQQRANMRKKEQDHLYGVSENENDDEFGSDGDEKEKNAGGDDRGGGGGNDVDGDGEDQEDGDDDEEEEELLLGGLEQDANKAHNE